jgi:hypothetical protein
MSFHVIVKVLGFLIVRSPLSLSCLTRNGLGVLSEGSPSFSRTVGQFVVPPSWAMMAIIWPALRQAGTGSLRLCLRLDLSEGNC